MTALVITLCVVFFIIAVACVVDIVKEIVEWIKGDKTMKARVKATGEIVRVLQTSNGDYEEYSTHNLYCPDELDFEVTDKDAIYNKGWQDGWDEAVKSEIPKIHPKLKGLDPDYWTRLEHQYAGMAMQGLMSYIEQVTPTEGRSYCDEIVGFSVAVAHALVEKMKEKEERK